MDPRQRALERIDAALGQASQTWDRATCDGLVRDAALVPGRLRPLAEAFAAQRTPAAVDALLALGESVPGVVEGLFHAVRDGVCRQFEDAVSPATAAVTFRRSRSRAFPEFTVEAHARLGGTLERLEIDRKLHYRAVARRADPHAEQLRWLFDRARRFKGTALWVHGWRFGDDGPIPAGARAHLLEAWLGTSAP